ncbi:MAG: nucleotide exchange factor GrpE [Cyclobacteriaceae bacterium]
MSKENNNEETIEKEQNTADTATEEQEEVTAETSEEEETEEEIDERSPEEILQGEVAEAKDKYLRLFSEFENFRRRTAREKLDLIKTASEELVVALIPVVDDFERALKNMSEDADVKTVREGVELVHQKFTKTLTQKGVEKIPTEKGDDFNDEVHEAITQIPAPEDKLKGKIVDVIEPGYKLGDKVIRFAKVVTGA